MTNMTAQAAKGSKVQPAKKVTNKTKAIGLEHSLSAQIESDDKVVPSVMPECAAVTLAEGADDKAPPPQPIAQATDDNAPGDVEESSKPAPEEAVDAATSESSKVSQPVKTSKKVPKSALVQKLLARARGATLAEMEEATGWQPHSVRAFLTGLRNKGIVLVRETRKDGVSAYRIAA